MAATITKGTNGVYLINISPAIDGNESQTIFHGHIVRTRIVETHKVEKNNQIPYVNFLHVELSNGEVIKLHYFLGISVQGNTATSNEHLKTLIDTMFQS